MRDQLLELICVIMRGRQIIFLIPVCPLQKLTDPAMGGGIGARAGPPEPPGSSAQNDDV